MIGVIGCGNMAQAIVKGYAKKEPSKKFMTYTPSFTRAESLALEVGGKAIKELKEFAEVQTIVLACKPQQFNDLVISLKETNLDLSSKHFISIMAATPIDIIKSKLGVSKVTRVMPNTPALIGQGVSLVIHSDEVEKDQKLLVHDFFSACGDVSEMPNEKTFDQVTTVSGSGPAYVFLFAKTFKDKLTSWGVADEEAKRIAIQLFRGSSELMSAESALDLDELISKVTSKGGVTIEAVNSYKKDNLGEVTSRALDAAFSRSVEMTKDSLNT